MTDDDLLEDRTLYPTDAESGPQRAGDSDHRPLAINMLFAKDSCRDLIDYFMTGDVDERGENQSQIAENSGVSRNSVGRNINTLVDFGLVEEKGDGAIRRYSPREDADVFELILVCNNALAEEYKSNVEGN